MDLQIFLLKCKEFVSTIISFKLNIVMICNLMLIYQYLKIADLEISLRQLEVMEIPRYLVSYIQ